jgi:hypothetical protein
MVLSPSGLRPERDKRYDLIHNYQSHDTTQSLHFYVSTVGAPQTVAPDVA